MPEQEPMLCCAGCDGELDSDGYCPSPSCDVNGAEHYDANQPDHGPMPAAWAPEALGAAHELLVDPPDWLRDTMTEVVKAFPPVTLALARAAGQVRGVSKDRTADENQGGYRFRGIDGVLGAVHHPLSEAGILMVPRDLEIQRETWPHWGHGKWTFYRVHLEWEIYGPRGDSFITTNWGEALDNGDKGLGKARSYAQKDLLIRLLTIPTDDPDMDTEATRYETDTPGVEGGQQQQGQRRRQASGGESEGGGDVAEPADPEVVAELQLIIAGLDDERKAKVREAWMRALGGTKPEQLDARAAKRARALITGMVPDHAKVLEQTRMKVQIGDLPDPTTPEPEDDGAAQGDGSEGDTSSTATAEASHVDARAEGDTSAAATGDASAPASDDGSAPGGDDASVEPDGEGDSSPRREQNRSIATVLRSWIDAIGDPKVLEQHTTEVSEMAWQTVDKDLRDTFGVDAPGELHVDLRRLALVVGRAVGPEAIGELIAEGHLQPLEQPEGE